MPPPPCPTPDHPHEKNGFILFYAMAIVAVLSLVSIMALNSAGLESRTAVNHYHATRALYHAEAGIKLVKQEVENRLEAGETLEYILGTLSVSPPDGVHFDTIDSFNMVVPERLFNFESVGRSRSAQASVVVHFRRKPLINMGMFGDILLDAQNHVSIYGYDSRIVSHPTPADNNGGASIGSNGEIILKNHFTFDGGTLLLGETDNGLTASCTNCDSEDYTQVQTGENIEADPLGLLSGGPMADTFADAEVSNDNDSVAEIKGTSLYLKPDQTLTLSAGDYYLTSAYFAPNSELLIDADAGPVRIFMDGEFNMQPNSDLSISTNRPKDFQIYSISTTDSVNMQPNGSLAAFVYAPGTTVNMQPGNHFQGVVWGNTIEMQPSGQIYLDTSLSESMLNNNLEIHAWYEQQGN